MTDDETAYQWQPCSPEEDEWGQHHTSAAGPSRLVEAPFPEPVIIKTNLGNTAILYCGDCLDGMRSITNKKFPLAIVDPPYGIGRRLSQGAGKLTRTSLQTMDSSWDILPTDEYFRELFRISKNQIIWGGNYFSLPPSRGIVCWDKIQSWENFSAWEYGWTSFDYPAKIYRHCCHAGFIDSKNDSPKIHPTQKPVQLYKWLLSNYAKPMDDILDTHMGSGSSVIASLAQGHNITAYEIDTKYFNVAVTRIRAEAAQNRLF
jgi:site-specific DNA-methyltransferase (adenine-specific)